MDVLFRSLGYPVVPVGVGMGLFLAGFFSESADSVVLLMLVSWSGGFVIWFFFCALIAFVKGDVFRVD